MAKTLHRLLVFSVVVVIVSGLLHNNGYIALSVAVLLFLAAMLFVKLKPVQNLLDKALLAGKEVSPVPAKQQERYPSFLLGLIMLATAIYILEHRQPYYFAQDDNFSWLFPNILLYCKGFFSGTFCTWNPYQLLGMPLADNPQSIYFYPPVYAAYYIACSLFSNQYLTVDILCIMHVAVAYAAMYWLMRYIGIRPVLAATGALSLALSGFVMVMGRSWATVLCTSLWAIPQITLVAKLQREPVTWKWAVWAGLSIGIPAYAGSPQIWVYSVMFMLLSIAVMVISHALDASKALWIVPALLIGIAVAAPITLPQLEQAANAYQGRSVSGGDGIQRDIMNLILPYPLSSLGPDSTEQKIRTRSYIALFGSENHKYLGQFYYSGTLFYAIAFLVLLASLAYTWKRKTAADNIWYVMAFITLVFALGPEGILWACMSKLPIFCKFTGPMKFLGLLNLFVILGSGLALERLLLYSRRGIFWALALCLPACALLLYHVSLPLPSFYNYGDRPYPALSSPMLKMLSADCSKLPARTLGIATILSPVKGYTQSLTRNFPTIYHIPSFDGYDPLIAVTHENLKASHFMESSPLEACKAYGIRWLVVHSVADCPVVGPNYLLQIIESTVNLYALSWTGMRSPAASIRRAAKPAIKLPQVEILALPEPDPLAFPTGNPKKPLPLQLRENGIDVDISKSNSSQITVNFLLRPRMEGVVDGHRVFLSADKWGRIVATVPKSATELHIRYSPDWGKGLIVASILLILAYASIYLIQKRHHPDHFTPGTG